MFRARTIIAIALAGAIAGPLADQIHVATGTLSYAHPWLFGQAWWVAPQFAVAFVLLAIGFAAVDRGRAAAAPPPSMRTLNLQAAAFLGAYAVTGVGHEHPWWVFAVLSVALAARIVATISDLDTRTLRAMLILAIAGTTYEAVLASFHDTFSYAIIEFGAAPIWLPLLYAHGVPLGMSIARRLTATPPIIVP